MTKFETHLTFLISLFCKIAVFDSLPDHIIKVKHISLDLADLAEEMWVQRHKMLIETVDHKCTTLMQERAIYACFN